MTQSSKQWSMVASSRTKTKETKDRIEHAMDRGDVDSSTLMNLMRDMSEATNEQREVEDALTRLCATVDALID